MALSADPPEIGRSERVHRGPSTDRPLVHIIMIMTAVERFAFAALLALAIAIAPACAQEPRAQEPRAQEPRAQEPRAQELPNAEHSQAARVCLDQKERRAAAASGTVVRLAAAIHAAKSRMPGTVVQARLCHGQDGLVYVLTVLAHDGKVARIAVDAVKGTLVGER